jgi:CPA2 family monovalent cation:H+ antiporter-2
VLFAGVGEIIGVTDAIGAFLIGVVLGASTYRGRIERVAVPLRDIFAAFFFLNFGLALNAGEFGSVAGIVIIAVVMTFALNLVSGIVLALINKLGVVSGINAAGSLVNRGEFTLILATLSVGAGLDHRLQPFAGLYVLIMAILGPLFAANSERMGAVVRRRRHPASVPRPPRDPMLDEEINLVDAVDPSPAGTPSREEATRLAVQRMAEQARSRPAEPDERTGDYS